MATSVLSHLLQHQLVSIIRGANPDDLVSIVRALHAGGIRSVEITINSPKALEGIEKLATELGEEMMVGAGTVLDPETARMALNAGARFIISPTLNVKTIKMTKRYGAVSIPGAFTPTEILTAYEHGADLIKVFPASLGAAYFKDLKGPLPFIPLMPTGGVKLDNIREFQQAGAAAYGLGSSLVDTSQPVTDEYLQDLTRKAQQFVHAISNK
ncbi:bifunctional 4-hydroxy-2-oxoglutarate aldolase/2-dehydro-3-deoxy-phosphogluconate aldolase [Hymenobacter cellulosilyticus]|uniref:Bifunctional 4-hydroxy-2-oxoglutarate aldolase/2-dehydro-3-deoxy-phosphogluconate aldolase n=1 Tax=Hymenobacter cellulosilyticus TaxID=2932248 RepID=A0A8T9PZL5_9BACT|nr:bifunctional 4-hydroxy-2-oxoglutarate aldolase/2-dehydro-3-deoxy-phosphogluconate aldolase [Hymenobacter cellulosilyticus]UOQ70012.1 bifunctional 4-hydroxy-2-oxoglutarate aldolase/2-dehydro-3-deoxy-phosphogluconate aldolase [Hymenobacter cellulosilyticus]